MAQDKVLTLTKHIQDINNRLSTNMVGVKQVGKEVAYRLWLLRDLAYHTKKLEELKLNATDKKK